jgi:hypothetical protein
MSAVAGPVRLDDELWTPSALGCVGPGELAGLVLGVEALYRPLLAAHRIAPAVPDGDEGTVELVTGDAAWDRLCAEPEVQMAHGGRSHLRDDPDAIVVAVRFWPGQGLRTVLALRIDRLDPRIAEVAMAWHPGGADVGHVDSMVAAGWLALFRAAVERGVVGVTADVTHTGARQVDILRRHIGFRPVAEVYGEVGLGGVDAHAELDRWTATVSPSGAVDVRLEVHTGAAALGELAERLARLLAPRRRGGRGDDDQAAPAVALRLSGEVTFDGCRGWSGQGDGEDGGEQGGGLGTAEGCLRRWAQAQQGNR